MLKRLVRKSLKILPFAVLICLLLAIFDLTENVVARGFGECVANVTANQSYKSADQNRVIVGGFVQAQTICSLRLIDKHNGFFALLGTLAVACFTLTLWRSTERLERLGEQTAERQLRAYVMIDRAHFVIDSNISSIITGEIDVKIKNYGVTPTTIIMRWETKILKETNASELKFSEKVFVHPKASIAPGAFLSLRLPAIRPFGPNDRILLASQRKAIYLWGLIEYETFGKTRFTKFRLINQFTDVTTFGYCDDGNEVE